MTKIRLWICKECGLKYWPDPLHKWDMVCPEDGSNCRMVVEDEQE